MKQITIFLSAICLLLMSSCNDFLTVDPISEIGETGYYRNTEDINQAVLGCYSGLQKVMNNEWYLTELRTDNSRHYVSNSTNTLSKNIYDLDKCLVATTHPTNKDYWESVYHNIANCNVVLSHLDVVTEETSKRQFEGEAKFLRAYHYFNLVRLYGPVFLIIQPASINDMKNSERKPVSEVYAHIESDLLAAIDNRLPESYKDTDKGRANIWAAKTLLAKVYLTLGRLEDARKLLTDVESNSPYSILSGTDAYSKIFDINNEMNAEIIFNIRYKAGGYGLGSPFANNFAPANSFAIIITAGGDGYNCPTSDIIGSYDAKDKRKDVTLSENWTNDAGTVVPIAYLKKYLAPVSTKYDGENDWPVLRFADVKLMLAEIENELSGPSAGLSRLNEIRVRAGLNPLVSADIIDKNQFRLAIENERRLEFAYENHRFFDLVRTNRFIPVLEAHYQTEQIANSAGNFSFCYTDPENAGSYMASTKLEEWQLLLPIPFSVISVSPNVSQNPGY